MPIIMSSEPSIIKPPMWAIDPGIVFDNVSRMGLPMPKICVTMQGRNANDLTGSVENATVVGASWTPDGLDFSSSGTNVVNYGTAPIINNATDVTVLTLVDIATVAGQQAFACIYDDTDNEVFSFGRVGAHGGLGVFRNGGSAYSIALNTLLVTGLHQYGFTKKAGSAKPRFYVDGDFAELGHTTFPFEDGPATIRIGGDGTDDETEGVIRYSHWWDTILTDCQIRVVYNNPYGLVQQPRRIWAVAAGWSGKVLGVLDPAKVLGVNKASIAKILGA